MNCSYYERRNIFLSGGQGPFPTARRTRAAGKSVPPAELAHSTSKA